MATVREIYNAINKIAPFSLQESWDNAGMLVGDYDAEVKTAVTALDITNDVVAQAAHLGAQLVISHHPVIFNAIKNVPANSPVYKLAQNSMSAICAHTNLDISKNGTNYHLAKLLGCTNITPLSLAKHKCYKQIRVYVPESHTEIVYNAMAQNGAGQYDNYSGCAFINDGNGRFMPDKNANPFIGKADTLEICPEQLISMICPPDKLGSVIAAMLKAHPYETPAYEITDNCALYQDEAMGLCAATDKQYSPKELALHVKACLESGGVKLYSANNSISKIAICTGSGGSLLDFAISNGCDAFVTADVKHDVALAAIQNGITIIDAGHFETENIIIKPLTQMLTEMVPDVKFIMADCAKSQTNFVQYV